MGARMGCTFRNGPVDPDLAAFVQAVLHCADTAGEADRGSVLGRDVADHAGKPQRGEGMGAGSFDRLAGKALAFGGGAEEVAKLRFLIAGLEAEEDEAHHIAALFRLDRPGAVAAQKPGAAGGEEFDKGVVPVERPAEMRRQASKSESCGARRRRRAV